MNLTSDARRAGVRDEAVIWHDVECGSYDTDLPLWRDLAGAAAGPVLELGCGTGRVALDLARHGHDVTAIDSDARLIEALRGRAAERDLEVAAQVADARTLDLQGGFALIIAPMQMLQLLGGAEDRRAVMSAAAGHLAAAGRVAISIVEGVPGGSDLAQPLPDVAQVDGWVYSSLPLEIVNLGASMLVTRLRQVVSPAGDLTDAVDESRLAVLDAKTLEAEARHAGLRPAARRTVATTDLHVGSAVVVLERAGA